MPKLDWDDNDGPLAYLITFRTFGTWLHGDDRYSVDRHGKNIYGTPGIAPNEKLFTIMSEKMRTSAFKLVGKQRAVVESAIRSVCEMRGYGILALNIRTNHAHSVVSAWKSPNAVMSAFKANATRELRVAGLISPAQTVWSRGGSTRYLWKPNHVEVAVEYVLYGQGDELPDV
jgi:REP element-mobilizing transposase RayT